MRSEGVVYNHKEVQNEKFENEIRKNGKGYFTD